MARLSSSSTKKKHDGPKGKKARAKAKLERQWGEQVVEETPQRKGKSRLLSNSSKLVKDYTGNGGVIRPNITPTSTGMETDRSSTRKKPKKTRRRKFDFNEEEDDQAFKLLLQKIEKSNKGTSKDDDEHIEANSSLNDGLMSEKSNEDSTFDQAENDLGNHIVKPPIDPFVKRFLNAETSVRASDIKFVKLDMAKYGVRYAEHLDIQVSGLDVDDILELSATTPGSTWSRLSLAFLANVRPPLQERWKVTNKGSILDTTQTLQFPFVGAYADILWTDQQANRASSEHLVALHILQHVISHRNLINRNNRILQDAKDSDNLPVIRDQGYCRPTVLILLPTRGQCYSFVKHHLLPLLGENPVAENLDRFETEYGIPVINESATDATIDQHRKATLRKKGKEWLELFGDHVNDDDDFRMGISFNTGRKRGMGGGSTVSVKLFADFFRSDIIMASPLGLKMTAHQQDGMHADFLSSIEICLLTRADVLMMQNWDHVTDVLALLNGQPRETNETDFSRVRHYFLDGQAERWRQVIVMAPFLDPLMLSSFKRYAKSSAGQVRVRRRIPTEDASITKVIIPTRQVFQRVPCVNFASQGDDRVSYFTNHILPQLFKQGKQQKHTLIFIPSYFDFVSLRNVLLKRELEFVSVTEYARVSETTRGRARFLQGRKPWMLYTGRAHFFFRHVIKGARHVVFVGLPEYSNYYPDHLNILNEGLDILASRSATDDDEDGLNYAAATASCLTLFTKFEVLALERIVGYSFSNRMVKGERSTFLFSS